MLTLDIFGKPDIEAAEIVRSSIKNESEVKISINAEQFENVRKILVSEYGFTDVILEDDEGILYVIASGREILQQEQESQETEQILLAPIEVKEVEEVQESEAATEKIIVHEKNVVIQDSLALVLSYENKKYRPAFMQKFIRALKDSRIKPAIIALMDNAVSLAAYNAKTCEDLKTLESLGVNVLVSDSCADRLGLTEALGAGILLDMSEILAKIFECEKVVSL